MANMENYDPIPTPEEEEEWERQRKADWEYKIRPYKEIKSQLADSDELMAEMLFELTLLEFGE